MSVDGSASEVSCSCIVGLKCTDACSYQGCDNMGQYEIGSDDETELVDNDDVFLN